MTWVEVLGRMGSGHGLAPLEPSLLPRELTGKSHLGLSPRSQPNPRTQGGSPSQLMATLVGTIHDHRLNASLDQPAFRFVKSIAQEVPDSSSSHRLVRTATGTSICGPCVSAKKVLRLPTRMRLRHSPRPLSGPPSSTNGIPPPLVPPSRRFVSAQRSQGPSLDWRGRPIVSFLS
ncbi:hypothetical protein FA13DRAFT_1177458 [Coprinellus micaceus]|uniref:Uncharacterized protein n=1 Tax=Coprinellus micaceus TaxID=71717 RepID=A0A4Y7STW3_COPMI|nr:hypothetical protein FA13DRAFT_1177458 [Coprinellus micaceus]